MSGLSMLGVWDDMPVAIRIEFIVLCLIFLVLDFQVLGFKMEMEWSDRKNINASGTSPNIYTLGWEF